jgi:hypothetical protein
MLTALDGDATRAELALGRDEICNEGARRMLGTLLEAEVDACVPSLTAEPDEDGHRLLVRKGHARRRTITTGPGRSKSRPGG